MNTLKRCYINNVAPDHHPPGFTEPMNILKARRSEVCTSSAANIGAVWKQMNNKWLTNEHRYATCYGRYKTAKMTEEKNAVALHTLNRYSRTFWTGVGFAIQAALGGFQTWTPNVWAPNVPFTGTGLNCTDSKKFQNRSLFKQTKTVPLSFSKIFLVTATKGNQLPKECRE